VLAHGRLLTGRMATRRPRAGGVILYICIGTIEPAASRTCGAGGRWAAGEPAGEPRRTAACRTSCSVRRALRALGAATGAAKLS